MSDENGSPSNHVHPPQNLNDLDIATANTDVATENQDADTHQMLHEGLGMTMEDVDMLNAMHAEGLDANEHGDVDISALLQSLADQDGLEMQGIDVNDHAQAMNQHDDGQTYDQDQASIMMHGNDTEGPGDIDAGQDEVQADQDALLAAVRALEGMDGEHLSLGEEAMDLGLPDLSEMEQAEVDALGADLISTIEGASQQTPQPALTATEAQPAPFIRSTTPIDPPPQSHVDRYRVPPSRVYRVPAPHLDPSASTLAPPTNPMKRQQAPIAASSSSVPALAIPVPSSASTPMVAPIQAPAAGLFPRSPPLQQELDPPATQDASAVLPTVSAPGPPSSTGVTDQDARTDEILPAPLSEPIQQAGLATLIPGIASPSGKPPIQPESTPEVPVPAVNTAQFPATNVSQPLPVPATDARPAIQTAAPQAPVPDPTLASTDLPAITAPSPAPTPASVSAPLASQPFPAATPSVTAEQLPVSTATEIDDSLIDPMLFADSEGFDPDTLANLAALSRIANEEDDDVAVGGPEDDAAFTAPGTASGSGAGADEVAVPPTDRNRRRKSRAQEPELSRDQVRALVEGLSKGDKERRGDTEGEGTEDEQGDAGAAALAGGKAEDDELRHKGEQLREVGQAEKDDVKDRDYAEEGQDDGKRKKKRKRNRTTLSCTECHRRCDRNIPCSRCVARGVPSLCKMEYPDLPPPKKKKQPLNPLPINHELGLRVQALEILLRAGSNMDSGAANVAAMDTIMQATRAAQAGNLDAGNALASLTTAAGGDLSKMGAAEQNGLLMEVLQQLSSASMARTTGREEIPEATDDPWSTVPEAAVESLLKDPNPDRDNDDQSRSDPYTNLAVPGFREDNGNIFIPPTVRYIEKKMRDENILAKEPLSIQGDPRFLKEATTFAYGADSPAVKKDLSISISGALRIARGFLARFPSTSSPRVIYVPDPISWEDEVAIKSAGSALEVRRMRFLDSRGNGVDWEGMREDLMSATPGSAVLLYVGGSMPCGAELSASLWRLLALILLERQLIPLCILAFQGLASGDPSRDAQPMRFMVHEGLPVLAIQSFDSTMGIHADSPSVLSLVTQSKEVKQRVESQFRAIAKGMYLHPTPWGAHVVQAVMKNQRIYTAWLAEIKAMSDRLRSVRDKLYDLLVSKQGTPGNWLHIKRAHGMYCSTMLDPHQIRVLAKTRNIHLLPDGSVSLGSLNAQRIDTLAKAIDTVVRTSIKEAEEARQRAIALEEALTAAREAAAKAEAEAAAEAAARAAKEAESRAREEDAAFMEQSIAEAMMRQAEEVQEREQAMEREREDEMRDMDEAIKKAQASVDVQRRAEEILAGIGQASSNGSG